MQCQLILDPSLNQRLALGWLVSADYARLVLFCIQLLAGVCGMQLPPLHCQLVNSRNGVTRYQLKREKALLPASPHCVGWKLMEEKGRDKPDNKQSVIYAMSFFAITSSYALDTTCPADVGRQQQPPLLPFASCSVFVPVQANLHTLVLVSRRAVVSSRCL